MPTMAHQLDLLLERDEADAMARALSAELKSPALFDRISRVYFDRPNGAFQRRARKTPNDQIYVRTTASSVGGDAVVLEVIQARGEARELSRLELPRRALRAAMRGATAHELMPSLPQNLEPVLTVTADRQRFIGAGWDVELCREVSFHPRVDVRRAAHGRALHTAAIRRLEGKLPAWLEAISLGMRRYSEFTEGTRRIQAVPSVPRELEAAWFAGR